MIKVLKGAIITSLFILITACSDGAEDDLESIEDTDDIETLISTNQRLVEQVESEREENRVLQERLEDLEAENMSLKDNILTYRQELIEKDNLRTEELTIRNEVDELAKEIFQAMHERNHLYLEELVADNIFVDSNSDRLEIYDDEGRLYYTLHYIPLNTVNYVRQKSFQYNQESETFVAEYVLYSADSKDFQLDAGVEMTFVFDGEWKLFSMVR
ncbi:hypothetical protein [Evansella tamaricis]|uniref:Uncharacterized protein n=1 Tax=Evansella tamaricis TaxID=2069301 RepID=A0ABS6JNF6_9BACI|nr:hypothetical protein [Evansella tamaricis]MBU9713843.1 hypothetical protein [Evansella tamaricis]